jgi:hypothetical protein
LRWLLICHHALMITVSRRAIIDGATISISITHLIYIFIFAK